MKSPVDRRFKGNDRIIKFFAVGTEDGLDNHMPAPIRATRHPRAVTAFGTFEEIRAAHKPFAELRPACSRFAGFDAAVVLACRAVARSMMVNRYPPAYALPSFGAAVFALRVAPSEDWWVGRDSNPGPMP